MVLTSFLHKLLYTYTSIDRYLVFNPAGVEAHMFACAIGIDVFSFMICEYIFTFIILIFWIPNTYLFHLPWLYVKIAVIVIASLLTHPFTKIGSSESYKTFVREHYYDSKFPTLKWHILAIGLHVVSITICGIIIVFL